MYSLTWRRPEEPVNPEIWSRFEKTTKDGELLKFRIQTMTDVYKEDVLDMYFNHFSREETIHSSAGCGDCPEYKAVFRQLADVAMFPQQNILTCILDNDEEKPKLVGINLCAVCEEGDELDLTEVMNTTAGAKLIQIWLACKPMLPDPFILHNVKSYLGSLALSVLPEYRGLSISKELLTARIQLCKKIGMKWTSAVFTGATSQAVALKVGFKEYGSVPFDEISRIVGFKLKNNPPFNKLMSFEIK